MIEFACPKCGEKFSTGDQNAGRKAPCQKCGNEVQVPGGVAAIPTPATSSPSPQPAAPSQARAFLAKFLNEEQDPAVVERVHTKVKELLTSQEEIMYIAVQKKPVMNLNPDCVILTSRRVIIYKPKLLGQVEMHDYQWLNVFDARVKEGITGATLSFRVSNGGVWTVDYLPKSQARCLYRFAQEMEEKANVQRRQMDLESSRAAAGGGIVVQTQAPQAMQLPQPAQPQDDMAKLQKLKAMLDASLISAAEYDAKKAEILARM